MNEEQKILRRRISMRKYLVFVFFLVLTIIFWLMNKLAQDYVSTIQVTPNIKNSLSAAVYTDAADNTLYIQMKATGFFLLRKKFYKKQNVIIDLRDASKKKISRLNIPTNTLKDRITENFDKNIQIISIEPDTIYFNVSGNISKKVPVVANFELSFKNEYRRSSAIDFLPDSVTIRGSQEDLDNITYIELESKKYENLDETVEDISNIITDNDRISVNPQKVRYKIPIERSTEGVFSVPIKMINVPKGSNLILIPSQVKVRFIIPVKDYNTISEKDFLIEVDYNDTAISLNRLIKAKLVHKPKSVFEVKLEPSFVEFLIQQ